VNIKKYNILGSKISSVKLDELEILFQKNNYSIPKYICISNVHTVIAGRNDKELQKATNNSWLSITDSNPLTLLGNELYGHIYERIFGADLMLFLLNQSKQYGYTHYLYGSTDETLNQLKQKLNKKYGKYIKGYFSPPFRDLKENELEEHFDKINSLKPNFIWIGFGAPKQEKLMLNNLNRLDFGVLVGVGAAFNYLAGDLKRAPKLMQKYSLEWAYRLYQEPVRLFKRYAVTNSIFIMLSLKELFKKYLKIF